MVDGVRPEKSWVMREMTANRREKGLCLHKEDQERV